MINISLKDYNDKSIFNIDFVCDICKTNKDSHAVNLETINSVLETGIKHPYHICRNCQQPQKVMLFENISVNQQVTAKEEVKSGEEEIKEDNKSDEVGKIEQ